jgi:hypothetical protein
MDIVDLRPMIVGAHETQVNMTFRDPSNRQPAFTLTLKRFTSRPISRSSMPLCFSRVIAFVCASEANCHPQAPPPLASPQCPPPHHDPCSPCHAQARQRPRRSCPPST